MYQLPVLPQGSVAQPIWLRQLDEQSLEFAHVYDAAGRLDAGRCYWMVSAPDSIDATTVRYVTWNRLREQLGRRAPSFARFSSFKAPAPQLVKWFHSAGARLSGESPREVTAGADRTPLPWNYYGLRRAGDGWVRTSGYVPSDGEETEAAARDAADLLGADAVVLEDARHHVISVRGTDGLPVEVPEAARVTGHPLIAPGMK